MGDLEGSNSRVRAETRQRRDQRGEAEAHLSGRAITQPPFFLGGLLGLWIVCGVRCELLEPSAGLSWVQVGHRGGVIDSPHLQQSEDKQNTLPFVVDVALI